MATWLDSHSDATQILSRLNELSPETAQYFDVRPSSLSSLVFRLYYEAPHSSQVQSAKLSYIAVSYRWPGVGNPQCKCPRDPLPSPFPKGMVAAILQERTSHDEGFWYDQGCIDQSNEEKKSVAIGLMDVIYRRARAVVVALDMTVTREQLEAIEEYKKVYDEECATLGEDLSWSLVMTKRSEKLLPGLAKKHFRVFVEAFLNSGWFGRAWCDHEARLASRLIFLAACETSGHEDGDSMLFLRFTDCFAYNILFSYVEIWDMDPEKDTAHIRKWRRGLMNICQRKIMREMVERARKLGNVARVINNGIGDSRQFLLHE